VCRRKLGVSIAKPLGKHCDTCINSDSEILDVDFVSTTLLSSNVHGVRHNYFHLNRHASSPPGPFLCPHQRFSHLESHVCFKQWYSHRQSIESYSTVYASTDVSTRKVEALEDQVAVQGDGGRPEGSDSVWQARLPAAVPPGVDLPAHVRLRRRSFVRRRSLALCACGTASCEAAASWDAW
jgi:hypothetical protein